jgi:hypothetical protein
LYGFSVILFWGDLKLSDGFDSGHWFWGTTLYLAVLLTVLGKAALISEYVAKYTNKMDLLKGELVTAFGPSTLLLVSSDMV